MVSRVTDPVYVSPRRPGVFALLGVVMYLCGLIATYQAELPHKHPGIHDWPKVGLGFLGLLIGGVLIMWLLATLPMPMVAPRLRTAFVLVVMMAVASIPMALYLLAGPPLYVNGCVVPNEPILCSDHHTFVWRYAGGLVSGLVMFGMCLWAVRSAFGKIAMRWVLGVLVAIFVIIGQATQSQPLQSYDEPHPSPTVTVSPR